MWRLPHFVPKWRRLSFRLGRHTTQENRRSGQGQQRWTQAWAQDCRGFGWPRRSYCPDWLRRLPFSCAGRRWCFVQLGWRRPKLQQRLVRTRPYRRCWVAPSGQSDVWKIRDKSFGWRLSHTRSDKGWWTLRLGIWHLWRTWMWKLAVSMQTIACKDA